MFSSDYETTNGKTKARPHQRQPEPLEESHSSPHRQRRKPLYSNVIMREVKMWLQKLKISLRSACLTFAFVFFFLNRKPATPSWRKPTSWKWPWSSSVTFPLLTSKVSKNSAPLNLFNQYLSPGLHLWTPKLTFICLFRPSRQLQGRFQSLPPARPRSTPQNQPGRRGAPASRGLRPEVYVCEQRADLPEMLRP